MGIGEESKPPNPSKPASSAQEIPTTHYFDWSSSIQTPNPLHVNVELEGKGPYVEFVLKNPWEFLEALAMMDSYGSKKRRFHHMVADGANAQSHTVGAIGEASVPPASLSIVMGSESVMLEQLI